jgi:hypothetical protein
MESALKFKIEHTSIFGEIIRENGKYSYEMITKYYIRASD